MVEPTAFLTMGELLEESGETEEEDCWLDKIKQSARKSLPEGWTNWKTRSPTKEELFGENTDPQILNKVRFALPSMEYVRIFLPDAEYVAEEPYREIKVCMLKWALCRALIISPPAIVNRIKGSAAQAEIFINAIEPMCRLILTRLEVCRQLRQPSEDEEGEEEDERSAKRSRLEKLEEKVNSPAYLAEHKKKV